MHQLLPDVLQFLSASQDILLQKVEGGVDTGRQVMAVGDGVMIDQVGENAVLPGTIPVPPIKAPVRWRE